MVAQQILEEDPSFFQDLFGRTVFYNSCTPTTKIQNDYENRCYSTVNYVGFLENIDQILTK